MSKYIRPAITAIVISLFILYFIFNIDKFKPLAEVNIFLMIAMGIVYFLSLGINGLFIRSILRPYKKHIGIIESFYVSLITSIGNFFAPSGTGMGLRAVYLKKKHGLGYDSYLSVLAGNYVLVLLVSSFFGIVGLLFVDADVNYAYKLLLSIFTVIFLTCILLISRKMPHFLPNTSKHRSFFAKVTNLLKTVANGWRGLVKNRRLLIELIAITFMNFGFSVLLNYLLTTSINIQMSLAQLLIFSVISTLSIFINITPANIGVKEIVYLFSASVLGLTTQDIVSLAIIDRGVLFVVLFLSWIIFNVKARSQKLVS